jgi:uncharacterized membrane protein YheB (UPF0754 family)
MNYGLVLIPLISAFIGWLANRALIKMLFHPRKPKRILWFTIQGLFPKRQQQFAEKIGKLVSTELLLMFGDIEQKITNPANLEKIMPDVEAHIDRFLRVKLAEQMPMISMFIGEKTIVELKTVFTAELKTLFPVIMEKYLHTLQSELNLEGIVIEKIAGFSPKKLEQILNSSMSK